MHFREYSKAYPDDQRAQALITQLEDKDLKIIRKNGPPPKNP